MKPMFPFFFKDRSKNSVQIYRGRQELFLHLKSLIQVLWTASSKQLSHGSDGCHQSVVSKERRVEQISNHEFINSFETSRRRMRGGLCGVSGGGTSRTSRPHCACSHPYYKYIQCLRVNIMGVTRTLVFHTLYTAQCRQTISRNEKLGFYNNKKVHLSMQTVN